VVYKLVEAAMRAPTAHSGEQLFFIIVIRGERRRIHEPLRRAHEYYARRALREPMSSEVVERWLKRINEGV